MIRRELDQHSADDLLVFDINGQLIEASCANVFWFKDKQLYTPEITDAGIAGLKRAQILAAQPNAQQVKVTQSALIDIDAMFITNCIMGIVPVHHYNDQVLSRAPVFALQEQFASS